MRIRTTPALTIPLLLSLLAACGSENPTATLIMPAKVAMEAEVSVEGAYSVEKAGLEVTLTSKGDDEVLGTTTTAKDGRYKLTFTPAGTGQLAFVASVTEGEYVTASKARTLLVLGKTAAAAKLKGADEARVGATRSLVGKVEPAGEVRTVTLESSPDAKAWTATAVTAQTDATGAFALPINTAAAGEQYFRASVKGSDTRSETATVEAYLGVYDYMAAGVRYLKCVEELNVKNDEFHKLTGLSTVKESAGRMVKRSTNQAKCFRGYQWPPSVAADAETIAANNDMDADVWNQMSKAETQAEFDGLSYGFTDDSGPPTRIRARLGLPQRPV